MQSLKVKVLNDEFALLVENPELTLAAAKSVDQMMQDYKKQALELSSTRIAVLVAIHFAEKSLEQDSRMNALNLELEKLSTLVERESS